MTAGVNAYLIKPNGFERLTEIVIKFIEENRTKLVSKIPVSKN